MSNERYEVLHYEQVIDYKIISAGDEATFETGMAQALKEGYEPYGEFKLKQPTGNFHGFFQAVVKYAPPTTTPKDTPQ